MNFPRQTPSKHDSAKPPKLASTNTPYKLSQAALSLSDIKIDDDFIECLNLDFMSDFPALPNDLLPAPQLPNPPAPPTTVLPHNLQLVQPVNTASMSSTDPFASFSGFNAKTLINREIAEPLNATEFHQDVDPTTLRKNQTQQPASVKQLKLSQRHPNSLKKTPNQTQSQHRHVKLDDSLEDEDDCFDFLNRTDSDDSMTSLAPKTRARGNSTEEQQINARQDGTAKFKEKSRSTQSNTNSTHSPLKTSRSAQSAQDIHHIPSLPSQFPPNFNKSGTPTTTKGLNESTPITTAPPKDAFDDADTSAVLLSPQALLQSLQKKPQTVVNNTSHPHYHHHHPQQHHPHPSQHKSKPHNNTASTPHSNTPFSPIFAPHPLTLPTYTPIPTFFDAVDLSSDLGGLKSNSVIEFISNDPLIRTALLLRMAISSILPLTITKHVHVVPQSYLEAKYPSFQKIETNSSFHNTLPPHNSTNLSNPTNTLVPTTIYRISHPITSPHLGQRISNRNPHSLHHFLPNTIHTPAPAFSALITRYNIPEHHQFSSHAINTRPNQPNSAPNDFTPIPTGNPTDDQPDSNLTTFHAQKRHKTAQAARTVAKMDHQPLANRKLAGIVLENNKYKPNAGQKSGNQISSSTSSKSQSRPGCNDDGDTHTISTTYVNNNNLQDNDLAQFPKHNLTPFTPNISHLHRSAVFFNTSHSLSESQILHMCEELTTKLTRMMAMIDAYGVFDEYYGGYILVNVPKDLFDLGGVGDSNDHFDGDYVNDLDVTSQHSSQQSQQRQREHHEDTYTQPHIPHTKQTDLRYEDVLFLNKHEPYLLYLIQQYNSSITQFELEQQQQEQQQQQSHLQCQGVFSNNNAPSFPLLSLTDPHSLPTLKKLFINAVYTHKWTDFHYSQLDLFFLASQQCCCPHRIVNTQCALAKLVNTDFPFEYGQLEQLIHHLTHSPCCGISPPSPSTQSPRSPQPNHPFDKTTVQLTPRQILWQIHNQYLTPDHLHHFRSFDQSRPCLCTVSPTPAVSLTNETANSEHIANNSKSTHTNDMDNTINISALNSHSPAVNTSSKPVYQFEPINVLPIPYFVLSPRSLLRRIHVINTSCIGDILSPLYHLTLKLTPPTNSHAGNATSHVSIPTASPHFVPRDGNNNPRFITPGSMTTRTSADTYFSMKRHLQPPISTPTSTQYRLPPLKPPSIGLVGDKSDKTGINSVKSPSHPFLSLQPHSAPEHNAGSLNGISFDELLELLKLHPRFFTSPHPAQPPSRQHTAPSPHPRHQPFQTDQSITPNLSIPDLPPFIDLPVPLIPPPNFYACHPDAYLSTCSISAICIDTLFTPFRIILAHSQDLYLQTILYLKELIKRIMILATQSQPRQQNITFFVSNPGTVKTNVNVKKIAVNEASHAIGGLFGPQLQQQSQQTQHIQHKTHPNAHLHSSHPHQHPPHSLSYRSGVIGGAVDPYKTPIKPSLHATSHSPQILHSPHTSPHLSYPDSNQGSSVLSQSTASALSPTPNDNHISPALLPSSASQLAQIDLALNPTNQTSTLVPSLADTWGNIVNQRFLCLSSQLKLPRSMEFVDTVVYTVMRGMFCRLNQMGLFSSESIDSVPQSSQPFVSTPHNPNTPSQYDDYREEISQLLHLKPYLFIADNSLISLASTHQILKMKQHHDISVSGIADASINPLNNTNITFLQFVTSFAPFLSSLRSHLSSKLSKKARSQLVLTPIVYSNTHNTLYVIENNEKCHTNPSKLTINLSSPPHLGATTPVSADFSLERSYHELYSNFITTASTFIFPALQHSQSSSSPSNVSINEPFAQVFDLQGLIPPFVDQLVGILHHPAAFNALTPQLSPFSLHYYHFSTFSPQLQSTKSQSKPNCVSKFDTPAVDRTSSPQRNTGHSSVNTINTNQNSASNATLQPASPSNSTKHARKLVHAKIDTPIRMKKSAMSRHTRGNNSDNDVEQNDDDINDENAVSLKQPAKRSSRNLGDDYNDSINTVGPSNSIIKQQPEKSTGSNTKSVEKSQSADEDGEETGLRLDLDDNIEGGDEMKRTTPVTLDKLVHNTSKLSHDGNDQNDDTNLTHSARNRQ